MEIFNIAIFKKKSLRIFAMLLLSVNIVYGQDIVSQGAIVLPQSGQSSYTAPINQITNIISGSSITLGPGTTFPLGSTVLMSVSNSLAPPSSPAGDLNRNWIYVRNYDEAGKEIGTSKSFFDNNGKATQSQVKNETTSQVLASQTLYDLQGRSVATTLSAPINNSAFAYSPNFITSNNTAYSYLNFDGDPTNSANPYAKLNNPDVVDNTSQGTLGWYYSNNNNSEPMVAATGFPYSRTDFYHDGTGATKRSSGIGESLRMGSTHETTSNSFPVQNELINYLAIRNQFFPSAVAGNNPTSMAGQALQSVSTDQNGTSALSVTDLSGKMSLMMARADGGSSPWLSVPNTLSLSNVMPQYSFQVATSTITGASTGTGNGGLTVPNYAGFSINSTGNVIIYQDGAQIYNIVGNSYVYTSNGSHVANVYQVTSSSPFTVSSTDPTSGVSYYDEAEAQYQEPSGTAVQYFQLAVPSVVNTTGSCSIYDMKVESGTPLTFTSGNTLPVGYYKVVALAVSATSAVNTVNNVTVSYTNSYSDISYNYYNQLGQLIASIAPNGVQQLLQNGFSSYTSVSQLPFVTLYSYDLQGRLISTKSPDATGPSQFIYRQDGKIRFSQNAYQANPANAGTGNVEKFSYTNYDSFGRPIESGEYAVPAATFANLGTNTTILEATDPTGGLSGGTKLSQINTYYDIPGNTGLAAYTQDPGFLKGAVSYTSNANSTIYYNYDDHGRVTWTVKNITGLGAKTIDYTYNDQGNVTKVAYQQSTAAETFIHYYSYDADGRLTNVQTSRDGVNMTQQANYYYYLHGPLKRVELGNQLQGLDYVYTAQGWLKAINSPTGLASNDPGKDGVTNSFANDAFGMQLEYFPNDYSRIGSNINSISTGTQTYYNGTVRGISWQSNKTASGQGTGMQDPKMYTYTYDPKYQYTQSVWGTPNFTSGTFAAASNNMFQEKGITYDANGNIMAMQHTNSIGTLTDNFNYNYTPSTNQLASVANGTTNYGIYSYDEIGRLKEQVQTPDPTQPQANTITYLKYDVTGKITGIYADAAMTNLLESYSYDESGNRIKTVNGNGTTYYVYDADNTVMAIYAGTTSPALTELPVYGSSRLGTYYTTGNNYVYELRDNVGSVRVVINQNKNSSGQADIYTFDDYYPYGSIAENSLTSSYRYDYQGLYSEKDPVTGYNNFNLRMYDARIGRWLTTDPKGQFASSYEGMGNNPVNGNDPKGSVWHIGDDGSLIADQGDNVSNLASFLNVDLETAQLLWGVSSNWDEGTISNGIDLNENIAGNYFSPNTVLSQGSYGQITVGQQLKAIYSPQEQQSTITAVQPDAIDDFFRALNENYGFTGRLAYSMIDGQQVYVTHLLGIKGESMTYGIHADGTPATRKELTEDGIGVVTTLLSDGILDGQSKRVKEALENTGGVLEKENDTIKAYMGPESQGENKKK